VSNGFGKCHDTWQLPDNFSDGDHYHTYTTAGGGLLAIACLFFGAMIVRSGVKSGRVRGSIYGYTALVVAAALLARQLSQS